MMVPVVKKITEWISKNRQLAILLGGVIVLFILVIIALIPDSKKTDLALIEQPLFFYQKKTITLGEDVYKDFKLKSKKYNIYKIKNDNLNIKVEGIISQLLINAPTKTGYSNVYYKWENKSGDKIDYNAKTQSIKLNLANRLNIFPEIVSPSDDQLKGLLTSFVHKYINTNYEYSDITVEKKPNEIVISGRRMHNGLPLQLPGLIRNNDYISLDERFNLKGANISLVAFEETVSDSFTVLQPKNLIKVISNDRYPREISTDIPDSLDFQKTNSENKEFADNLENGEVSKPSSYKVKSIELVYLFSNTDQQFLTPVYRMNATGQISYNKNTYDVVGVINVSAIDPNHVYIPSNISFTE